MIDYHVHTNHSGDASPDVTVRDMCARAIEIGLDEIGFTEHLDFTPTDPSYRFFDYDGFSADIESARAEFSERLVIRAGLEVDYQVRHHEEIVEYLSNKKFDYLIGSPHYVDGLLLEYHEDYFPGKSAREAYLPFFEVALAIAESGMFDILAHMDLCKRYGVLYYGPLAFDEFRDEIEAILRAVIRNRMALEVNTSGLRQAPKETYPGIETLGLYRELGGRLVSLGSDAHRTSDLAAGIAQASAMAEELGMSHFRL